MNKRIWTKNWPTQEGTYWFYGWPYGKETNFDGNVRKPELNFVRVMKISNGNMVVREGAFWFKKDGGVGLFSKIEEPILPEISEMPKL